MSNLKLVLDLYDTKTVFTYLGPQPLLYTIDTELISKVLTSAELYSKPKIIYEPIASTFGDGLFTSNAIKWRHHRKLINPAFRSNVLRSFIPLLNTNAVKLVKKLDTLVGQGELNMNDLIQKATLGASMETIMGRRMGKNGELEDEVVKHYNRCV